MNYIATHAVAYWLCTLLDCAVIGYILFCLGSYVRSKYTPDCHEERPRLWCFGCWLWHHLKMYR